MTYRIHRSEGPEGTVFTLSGDLDGEHTARLEDLIAEELRSSILLDLAEVTLVARDAVRFLEREEARGVRIINCPEYVRSWIVAEKAARVERL